MEARILRGELSKHMYGNEELLDDYVSALIGSCNVLLLGAPGKAKSTLVEVTARLIGGKYFRLQGSPDARMTSVAHINVAELHKGNEVVVWKREFLEADIILLDEINRFTPQMQNNFLQMMAENKVQYNGQEAELNHPIFIATMNTQDEGNTALLPPLLDRFHIALQMRSLNVYNKVHLLNNPVDLKSIQPVISIGEFRELQALARQVSLSDEALASSTHMFRDLQLCHPTYGDVFEGAPVEKEFLQGFPSTCSACRMKEKVCSKIMPSSTVADRALQHLKQQAQGAAALQGLQTAGEKHVFRSLLPTLIHRLQPTPQAQTDQPTRAQAVAAIIDEVKGQERERKPAYALLQRLTEKYDDKVALQLRQKTDKDPLLHELASEVIGRWKDGKNRLLQKIEEAKDPEVLAALLQQLDDGRFQVVDKKEVEGRLTEKLLKMMHIEEKLTRYQYTKLKAKAVAYLPELAEKIKAYPELTSYKEPKMEYNYAGSKMSADFLDYDLYCKFKELLKAAKQ